MTPKAIAALVAQGAAKEKTDDVTTLFMVYCRLNKTSIQNIFAFLQ